MPKRIYNIKYKVDNPDEFIPILTWDKTSIIVKDRSYTEGDEVIIKEYYNGKLTGRECGGIIRHIQFWDDNERGLNSGYLLLSIDYSYCGGYQLLYKNYTHR